MSTSLAFSQWNQSAAATDFCTAVVVAVAIAVLSVATNQTRPDNRTNQQNVNT